MGWLDENTLSIQFADNTTDKIFLSPANNIPGLVVPCVFSGSLVRDPEAVVSVSGCKVGFCLKQEMYSIDKKAKLSKNKDSMFFI